MLRTSKPSKAQIQLGSTRHVRLCRAVLFQHGGRRRSSSACVYTSLVFCAFERTCIDKTEKKTTRCVCANLSEKRATFGSYNSLLMSDLMNHKAIWSNYRRIDIELFEELLIMHDIIYYYLLFQITN